MYCTPPFYSALTEAKKHFSTYDHAHLNREEFADLLKHLWTVFQEKFGYEKCKGDHPQDLLDAKINVSVKFHLERPDQFCLEDVNVLIKLHTVLTTWGIDQYFRHREERKA